MPSMIHWKISRFSRVLCQINKNKENMSREDGYVLPVHIYATMNRLVPKKIKKVENRQRLFEKYDLQMSKIKKRLNRQ